MNKKLIASAVTIVLIGIVGVFVFVIKKPTNQNQITSNKTTTNSNTLNKFLISGFPLKEIPLYKMKKVESSKVFVNTDPKNISPFNEVKYAYYNVVFETDATQKEFLDYYRKLYDMPFIEEFTNDDMVKGTVKDFKVTTAHYGSDNTVYLQVYFSSTNDAILGTYFKESPVVLEGSEYLVEHEKSFGLLNQKGGEIEYTKYFTVINSGDANGDKLDDRDEFAFLEEQYSLQYKNEKDFVFDEETHEMTWTKDGSALTISYSRDHGRVYVMLRKPML